MVRRFAPALLVAALLAPGAALACPMPGHFRMEGPDELLVDGGSRASGRLLAADRYLRQGRAAEALRVADEVLALLGVPAEGEQPAVLARRAERSEAAERIAGTALLKLGRPDEALARLERAGGSDAVLEARGRALHAQGELDLALALLTPLSTKGTLGVDGGLTLAKLHAAQGRLGEARAVLKGVLARSPDHPEALALSDGLRPRPVTPKVALAGT